MNEINDGDFEKQLIPQEKKMFEERVGPNLKGITYQNTQINIHVQKKDLKGEVHTRKSFSRDVRFRKSFKNDDEQKKTAGQKLFPFPRY